MDMKALGTLIEVNTVDQYQGRDKSAILYSCTRSKEQHKVCAILKETAILNSAA